MLFLSNNVFLKSPQGKTLATPSGLCLFQVWEQRSSQPSLHLCLPQATKPKAHLGVGSAPVQDQTLSAMHNRKVPLAKPLGRVSSNNNLLLILFYTRNIQNKLAIYPSGHQKPIFYCCLMPSYSKNPPSAKGQPNSFGAPILDLFFFTFRAKPI